MALLVDMISVVTPEEGEFSSIILSELNSMLASSERLRHVWSLYAVCFTFGDCVRGNDERAPPRSVMVITAAFLPATRLWAAPCAQSDFLLLMAPPAWTWLDLAQKSRSYCSCCLFTLSSRILPAVHGLISVHRALFCLSVQYVFKVVSCAADRSHAGAVQARTLRLV